MMMVSALALLAVVLGPVLSAGQVLTGYHPYLAPEPAAPTCAVRASVFIGTQYFDAVALSKPTASPVPTIVSGAINFEVENYLPNPVEVGFDRCRSRVQGPDVDGQL